VIASGTLVRVHAALALRHLVLVMALASCAGVSPTPPPTAEPVMPDDSGPREVLEVFLKSLVIHDCAVTRQLSTEAGFVEIGGFCQRIYVANFAIADGVTVQPDALRFTTRLTINPGSDVFPEGDQTVHFSLARQSNGAWRVIGGGAGP
jgi:hypothetical protein